MKRWMIVLPLLAATLFAQDVEERPDKQKQIRELIERMQDADPAERKKLTEQLQKLMLPAVWTPLDMKGQSVVVTLDNASQEQIAWNWQEEDGGQGKYTLTSKGGGEYTLRAELTGSDGEKSVFEDKGTLAELRKKYKFLKQFSFVALPPRSMTTTNPIALRFTEVRDLTKSAMGMKLRRPSAELEYHLKLPTETAWIVDSVKKGSQADKLGLKKFDLITHADREDLSEFKTLKAAKKELTVIRRGRPMTVSLQLESERDPR
ncbi:MAG: hypothetical protein ACYTEG_07635 [Planctomycetota bacterium]|jgi:hypothetical protein